MTLGTVKVTKCFLRQTKIDGKDCTRPFSVTGQRELAEHGPSSKVRPDFLSRDRDRSRALSLSSVDDDRTRVVRLHSCVLSFSLLTDNRTRIARTGCRDRVWGGMGYTFCRKCLI